MINYKSYYDLSRDVAAGIQKVPSVDMVVSIPKSGIIPATMIASFLNVQVMDIDSFIFTNSKRSGMRALGKQQEKQSILVVDDSVNTGHEMLRVRKRLAELNDRFDFVYCAVYGLDDESHVGFVDVVLSTVPQPRVFQWNYRNHIWAEHALFDMDGVLCVDPPDDKNDDGDLYREYILNAPKLFIPRRKIGAIVTSRLERFRPETEEWLRKANVKYGELIMLDLPTGEERRRLRAHAPFKAKVYKERPEIIFVESNWKQAKAIAEEANKPVICTENDIFLSGRDHLKDLKKTGSLFDYEALSTEQDLRRKICKLSERLVQVDPGYDADFGPFKGAKTPWQKEVNLEYALRSSDELKTVVNESKISTNAVRSSRKILLISVTFDIKKGAGAAASASRLRDFLSMSGDDVKTLSLDDFGEKLRNQDQPISQSNIAFWNQYHDGEHSRELIKRINELNPDVVVLGAVDRGVISALDLAFIRKPIVWVCRDNWVHTGGCLFKLDLTSAEYPNSTPKAFSDALTCDGYKSGCMDCPAIKDTRERVKARIGYDLKKAVYNYRSDIVFSPISDWLRDMMREAPLTKNHTIETTSNPIDTSLMSPIDSINKDDLRRKFNLPKGKKIVLLGAHSLQNPRKGVVQTLAAIDKRADLSEVHFVIIGANRDLQIPTSISNRVHILGFISNEQEKSEIYSAVDATVVPALQESLSVVASDSISCGVPVVAFHTSGLATFLVHRTTGYLANPFDFKDLMNGIKWVLYEADIRKMKESCRSIAVKKFDPMSNVNALRSMMDIAILKYRDIGPVPIEIKTLEKMFSLLADEHRFRHIHTRHLEKRLASEHAPVLNNEANQYSDLILEMRSEIEALRNSNSWRITGPLRAISRTLRK